MDYETRIIREGEPITSFTRRGWTSGPLIKRAKCDASYRLFYSPTPAGIPSTTQTQDTARFEQAVASSHPNHLAGLVGMKHSDTVVAS